MRTFTVPGNYPSAHFCKVAFCVAAFKNRRGLMMKLLGTSVVAAIASLAIIGAAEAQIKVPPEQEFAATPMQKGAMMEMPAAKMAAPAPAPKKKMMKHKMAKHKMMKHKMMKMKH